MKHKFIKDGKLHWALRLKIPILITLMLFMLPYIPFAQEPGDSLWTKIYGGDGNNDIGQFVQQTDDGGYIVVGFTNSFGVALEDVWLLKTDANGDTIWTRTYGGGWYDRGWCVQQTNDGGYIIAGYTGSFTPDNNMDVYLIKTDANGDTMWTHTYGEGGIDYGLYVQQTNDDGYVVVGHITAGSGYTDIYLIKTDANGNTLWIQRISGPHTNIPYEAAECVQQTDDSGYIIAGRSHSFNPYCEDVYLVKTDINGDTSWTRNYGVQPSLYGNNYANCVRQTDDGGYIVFATEGVGDNDWDFWLLKTNANGDTSWTRNYGGSGIDEAHEGMQTDDGGYIIVGNTRSFGPYNNMYVVKTDADGDTIWTRHYYIGIYDWVNGHCVQQTNDGGYIITGYGQASSQGWAADLFLMKVAGESPTTGSIAGTVTDGTTGNPIQDVYVEAVGTEIDDSTDVSGEYNLANLDAGTYDISFSHEDYEDVIETGIVVNPGDVTTLNIIMGGYPCNYVPGDANGDGNVMGNDVTYSVRYFKGLGAPPPDSCPYEDGWLYAAGDANGNCSYTGSDVTFLVAYFKGYNPEILWCPETPPAEPPLLLRQDGSNKQPVITKE